MSYSRGETYNSRGYLSVGESSENYTFSVNTRDILNVVSVILCHLWKVIWRSICLFTQERALRNVSVPKLNDPQARKLQILFRIGHFVPTWYGKPPTHFEIFSDVWTDLKLLQKQIILALPKEPAKSFPINLFYFNFIFRNQKHLEMVNMPGRTELLNI